MAYLRKEIKKYGTYISLVEAYRDKEGKAQQRRLANLGNINNYSEESLRNIARSLYELGGGNLKDLAEPELEELGRYNYGFYQIYSRILGSYGLDGLLNRFARSHKLSYDLTQVVVLMLIERLNEPASKRRNYFNQQEYLGFAQQIELHHLYRSLDLLDKYSDIIQKQIFTKGRDLFNLDLDVVFYDVTTLYFESQREDPESLRQKGFGKDGKVGDTQIVFSLLIDKNQQPVGYEIFEGNKYEGHTLVDALHRLQHKYRINNIILVADRGMLSRDNLEKISASGFEFIIGERLKNLPKQMIEVLTDIKQYKAFGPDKANSQSDRFLYTQLEYGDRTIIGTYSDKRARKDKHDRDKKVARAKELLKKPSKIKSKATRHYLKNKGEQQFELDEQKIKRAEKFDGFVAISTTASYLQADEVINQYTQLFKIEKTFRTFKHHLAIRPIFHWTNSRIKGHICMAFIAYTLLNHLQLKLSQNGTMTSEDELRSTIGRMQVSLVKVNQDNQLYMRSKSQELVKKINKLLKIKPLPNYLHPDTIHSYLK